MTFDSIFHSTASQIEDFGAIVFVPITQPDQTRMLFHSETLPTKYAVESTFQNGGVIGETCTGVPSLVLRSLCHRWIMMLKLFCSFVRSKCDDFKSFCYYMRFWRQRSELGDLEHKFTHPTSLSSRLRRILVLLSGDQDPGV